MKNIVLLFLFLVPVFLFAQYPAGTNKSRLGYQTTGDGLIWRGVAADTAIKPRTTANAYFQLDTVNRVLRRYIATQGSWQVVAVTPNLTPYALKTYVDSLYATDHDRDSTNELQTLTFASPLLGISDGNNVNLSDLLIGYVTGSGTNNRVPKWSALTNLTDSNIQDNGTAVSILNSKPFQLGQWTTAGRPSGTSGYMGYNTTTAFTEGYFTSQWENYITSTGAVNGQIPIFSSAGKIYGTNSLLWDNTNTRIGISTSSNVPIGADVTNSNGGNNSYASFTFRASTTASHLAVFGKMGTLVPPAQTRNAGDTFIYNGAGIGDITFHNDYILGRIRFTAGAALTTQMTLTTAGNLGIGIINPTVGIHLQRNAVGAPTMFLSENQSATGDARFQVKNDAGANADFIKRGSSNSSYKNFSANDLGIYTNSGNISILNDNASGNINFAPGASSSAKVTLLANGNLLIGTTTDVSRLLHVSGEARITDLATDTPTRIVGADADGDLGEMTTGRGVSIVAGVLGLASDSLEQNAGVLYVSKNGNNSTAKRNNPRRPFLTIKAAVTASQQGDLIYIYPGIYREAGTTLGRDSINFYCSPGVTVSNAVITDDYGTSDMDNGGYVRWFGSGVFDSCLVSIQHMNMRYHIEGDSINLTYIPFWKQVNYNDIRFKFKFRSVRTRSSQLVWIPGRSAELTYTRMNLIFEIDRLYSPESSRTYPLIHFTNGSGGVDSDAKSKLVDCNLIFDIKNIELTGAAAVGSFPRLQGLIFGAGGVVGRVHLQRSNITFNSEYITQTGSTGSTYETPFQGFENSHTLFGLGTFKLDSSRLNFNIKLLYADIHAFRIGEMYQGNKGMININGNFNTRSLATFHIEETGSGATGDTSILIRVNGNFSSDKEVITCYSTVPTEKITWQGNYTSFADKAVFAIKSDKFTLLNALLKNNGTTADIYAAEVRTIKVGAAFAEGLNLSTNVSTPSLENIGSPKLETYYKVTSTSSPQTLSNTYTDNLINQGGTQATFTLTFPASPVDGQVLKITYNNAITTLTLDGNGNTIVGSAVTTGVAGSQRAFKFYTGIGWIKLY